MCLWLFVYVYIYIYIHTSIYIYIYIHMYIYIYMYTHIPDPALRFVVSANLRDFACCVFWTTRISANLRSISAKATQEITKLWLVILWCRPAPRSWRRSQSPMKQVVGTTASENSVKRPRGNAEGGVDRRGAKCQSVCPHNSKQLHIVNEVQT